MRGDFKILIDDDDIKFIALPINREKDLSWKSDTNIINEKREYSTEDKRKLQIEALIRAYERVQQ